MANILNPADTLNNLYPMPYSTNFNRFVASAPMSMGVPMAPALAPQQQPPTNRPALAGATGNARGSMRQPALQMPNQRIGLGEAMIRMGGAGMAGASQGGLASMGAMTGAYGDIMDYNRAREMEEYNAQVAAANEEQRRRDALAARMARSSGKKDKDADPAAVAMADAQIETMETILEGLKQGGLTGMMDGTVMKWADRLGISDWWTGSDEGSKRAYLRQLLQEFKVDQTLTKTALTKGAISNQEMNLFMSPFPDIAWDNEGAWILQIEKRLEIAKKIRAAVSSAGDDSEYIIEEIN